MPENMGKFSLAPLLTIDLSFKIEHTVVDWENYNILEMQFDF